MNKKMTKPETKMYKSGAHSNNAVSLLNTFNVMINKDNMKYYDIIYRCTLEGGHTTRVQDNNSVKIRDMFVHISNNNMFVHYKL